MDVFEGRAGVLVPLTALVCPHLLHTLAILFIDAAPCFIRQRSDGMLLYCNAPQRLYSPRHHPVLLRCYGLFYLALVDVLC